MKNDGRKEDRHQVWHEAAWKICLLANDAGFSGPVLAKYGSALSQIPAL
jgi:hypothetical protein